MSFISREPSTFINIKLTSQGRRMLSLGKLLFKKAVLLDREIDYSIDRSQTYNIFSNRVLNPADYHPDSNGLNFDNTPAYNLSRLQIRSEKQIITAITESNTGFLSSYTNTWLILTANTLGTNQITYSVNASNFGTNKITLNNPVGSRFPNVGELVFIPWTAPVSFEATTAITSNGIIPTGVSSVGLWYRVSAATSPDIYVDRPIPNYTNDATSLSCFMYPYNGIETYYGSASTTNVRMWNLNIVRTNTIAGTPDGASGYTCYGSLNFNGTRRFFGFSAETPAVGFIHYTNEYTGNTYGEQLMEKSVTVNMPNLMWHHSGGINKTATSWGQSFYDYYGGTFYDNIAQTSFRELRDRREKSGITIGRVYHKLKLIVITDQELLNAMSYKSNRNYTYPDYTAQLVNYPKYPLAYSTSGVTGLCDVGYDYFVTYLPEWTSYEYFVRTSAGHAPAIHCGYIKKIKGIRDINENPHFLQIKFDNPDSFPYLRTFGNPGAPSNGGWNANSVQILVNRQYSTLNYDIGNVPANDWVRVSNSNFSGSNGIYSASTYSIEAQQFNAYDFIISQEDYNSGSTYSINSGIIANPHVLNFGDESFFFGTVEAVALATSFKSSWIVIARDEEMNSSSNASYNSATDSNLYITEVAILDDANQVVAVGKPTYPVRKINGKYIGFQLEFDF